METCALAQTRRSRWSLNFQTRGILSRGGHGLLDKWPHETIEKALTLSNAQWKPLLYEKLGDLVNLSAEGREHYYKQVCPFDIVRGSRTNVSQALSNTPNDQDWKKCQLYEKLGDLDVAQLGEVYFKLVSFKLIGRGASIDDCKALGWAEDWQKTEIYEKLGNLRKLTDLQRAQYYEQVVNFIYSRGQFIDASQALGSANTRKRLMKSRDIAKVMSRWDNHTEVRLPVPFHSRVNDALDI